jgi:RecB family exonuclease
LANDLLACTRRAAYGRDPAFTRWRRPSTFSVLGEASHTLTQLAMQRREWPANPGDRRSALVDEWDRLIEAGAAKLIAAWSPSEPPASAEWPGYQLTRSRTLRRAAKLAAQSRSRLESPTTSGGIEVSMTDPGSILVGRADRLDRAGGSTRVVDLKSGMSQTEPRSDQLRQLLLYAVLVQRTTGEWPSEIAVENASGEQFVLPLNRNDAESALATVLDAVSDFNLSAQAAGSFDARPDADTCRWCAYRVACGPYWAALRADWGHASVLGSIISSGPDDEGAHAMIEIRSPVDLGIATTHLAGMREMPLPGATWIAAVDLKPVRDPSQVRTRWSSRVAVW